MQSGLRDDAVEEQSTLAKEILDQTGTAVIFADRSGKDPAPESRGCGSVQICGRGGARPEPRPHHSGASAHRTLRGFDGAMKNRALKLEGRPTLTRGQHKNGRKLYVEMTFALVIAAGRRQGRLRSRPTSPNASNARGKWRRHRISPLLGGPTQLATNTRNPKRSGRVANAFQDHDKPERTYAAAGLGAKGVVAKALAAPGEVAGTQSSLIA